MSRGKFHLVIPTNGLVYPNAPITTLRITNGTFRRYCKRNLVRPSKLSPSGWALTEKGAEYLGWERKPTLLNRLLDLFRRPQNA